MPELEAVEESAVKADCPANAVHSLLNLVSPNIGMVNVIAGGRMSISVAVALFDATAYGKGQLQAIRKQPLSYEFYVVNSRVPVEQPRLTVPETVQQHTRPLAEGKVFSCCFVEVFSCNLASFSLFHGSTFHKVHQVGLLQFCLFCSEPQSF